MMCTKTINPNNHSAIFEPEYVLSMGWGKSLSNMAVPFVMTSYCCFLLFAALNRGKEHILFRITLAIGKLKIASTAVRDLAVLDITESVFLRRRINVSDSETEDDY